MLFYSVCMYTHVIVHVCTSKTHIIYIQTHISTWCLALGSHETASRKLPLQALQVEGATILEPLRHTRSGQLWPCCEPQKSLNFWQRKTTTLAAKLGFFPKPICFFISVSVCFCQFNFTFSTHALSFSSLMTLLFLSSWFTMLRQATA